MRTSLTAAVIAGICAMGPCAGAQAASQLAWQNEAVTVSAELTRAVDTKSAKVGEAVEATTTADARLDDGTMLAKGSPLIGHVMQAIPKSGGSPEAHLVLRFDHATAAPGHTLAVEAMIQSISAPEPGRAGGGFGPAANPAWTDASASAAGDPMSSAAGEPADMRRGVGNGPGSAATSAGLDAAAGAAAERSQAVAMAGSAGASDAVPMGRMFPVGNLEGVSFSNAQLTVTEEQGAKTASIVVVLNGGGKNFKLERGTRLVLNLLAQ
jgi:hypothetical protein